MAATSIRSIRGCHGSRPTDSFRSQQHPIRSAIPTLIPNGNSETTYYVNPNMKTGYSESFNVALQREVGSNFTVEAAFVASRGHHLSYEVGDLNMNLRTQKDGLIDANLGQIQGLTDLGWSEYNSLQVKVTKRVSQNLNFLANWTYSHAMDNGPAPFDLGHINSDTPAECLRSECRDCLF